MKLSHALLSVAVIAVAGVAALSAVGLIRPPDFQQAVLRSAIGGPFELTTHADQRLKNTDLLGKPFAIVFGFTNCPDVCPTTLLEMSQHLEKLGTAADRIRVVFVSIDPERDTPEHLKAYLANFDPRIVGLTGSVSEIAGIAKAYHAFYQKVPTTSGYTMNHTATVYLMGADGKYRGNLNFQEPQQTQFEKLKNLAIGGG